MKRRLILEFETEEDEQKIIDEVKRWINDEFWSPSKVTMRLENVS